MLKNIVLMCKNRVISCRFQEKPYLCIVFFIVLDLRLTKVGVQRCSFFYAYTFLKLSTTEFLVSTVTTTTVYHKVPMYKGVERVVVVEFRR